MPIDSDTFHELSEGEAFALGFLVAELLLLVCYGLLFL